MSRLIAQLNIKWEKLPEDYLLPDEPVDNINQPALAEALTDSLEIAGYLDSNIAMGIGISAKRARSR